MKELDKGMYFKAKAVTLETATLLRKRMTFSENLLWDKLKGKQMMGLRFRRQHPIEFYIADFYCHFARLVIEIDGEIHSEQIEYDEGREAEMEKYGLKIIRFTNDEVNIDIENVLKKIEIIIKERLQSPPRGI
jgi:very-short-patch-repair endonuclease